MYLPFIVAAISALVIIVFILLPHKSTAAQLARNHDY
jgi:preprotein translocase subunit SecG